MRRLLTSLFVAPVLGLVACGANDAGTGGSSGTSGTSGSATGTSASSATTGAGGGGAYVPPSVPTACAAPVVTPGATWSAPSGGRFSSLALGWDGQRAAVAYVASASPSGWSVELRMLHADGTLDGDAMHLGDAMSTPPPAITLAMHAGAVVVCMDHAAASVACFGYPGTGLPSSGFSTPGSGPSLATGAAGVGLVYGTGSEFHSRLLDDTGKPLGDDHVVATAQGAGAPSPILASNDDGYAALSVPWGSILWRFDRAFQEEEGHTLAGFRDRPTRIAGLGSTIGAVWPDTSEVDFRLADAGGLGAPVKIDATWAQPVYSSVDVTRAGASFAAVWSASEGHMGYRAIDAKGAPLGAAADVMQLGWDDNPVSIIGVADGFLVGSATGPGTDTMQIAHLACP